MNSNVNNQTRRKRIERTPLNGVYKGVVKDTLDESRTGRLKVHIPSLGKENNPAAYRECYWSSPFAGSTDPTTISQTELTQYEKTQKSYGMWMVPPDLNNQVLVAFGDGIGKYGYIIACLFSDKMNYMVPGMAAGLNYGDPELRMPVAEKNPYDERQTNNNVERPVHVDIAEGIVKQGLINDPLRGAGTASARRESPSQVFGILTPGPRAREGSPEEQFSHRVGGHQFVMDDNYDSRMIRFRTAGGNQIMLDDTSGTIYMINKAGTAWFELAADGTVNMFAEGSINYRAKGNFNLRADKNINIEAGQNLNLKAAENKVTIESVEDMDLFAGTNFKATSGSGDVDINSAGRVGITAGGSGGVQVFTSQGSVAFQSARLITGTSSSGIHWNSSGQTALTGSQVLLNSGGPSPARVEPAVPALQIGTSPRADYASEPPGFDRESARRGGSGPTTNGDRRQAEPVDTILSVMTTAEPYAGHGQADPSQGFASPPRFSSSLVENLPPGASDLSGVPDDVVTPGGFSQGVNYLDPASGNPITGAGSPVAQGVANAQNIINGVPNYNQIGNISSQFKAAQSQLLSDVAGLGGLIAGLRSVVPPIRSATTNAAAQRVIGLGKVLSQQAAELGQFAVTAQGQNQELNARAITNMRNKIQQAINSDLTPEQLERQLDSQGIRVIPDGPGTIFEDESGNRIVDFRNGIGPIGTTLGAVSDLTSAFEDIKGSILVPITANQALSLASFAQSIGVDSFRASNVLDALNDGKYSEVPRLMQGWSVAPSRPGENGIVQPSLRDRRLWESEIFQTPDGVEPDASGFAEGESSFRQQAENIRIARDRFVASRS